MASCIAAWNRSPPGMGRWYGGAGSCLLTSHEVGLDIPASCRGSGRSRPAFQSARVDGPGNSSPDVGYSERRAIRQRERMLRDVVENDLPIFYEQQLDSTSTRMAAFPPREEWSVFLAHWKTKVLADPANRAQTIVWNERVAGYIASWSQEERRLIAYWIGREYWGRGIA